MRQGAAQLRILCPQKLGRDFIASAIQGPDESTHDQLAIRLGDLVECAREVGNLPPLMHVPHPPADASQDVVAFRLCCDVVRDFYSSSDVATVLVVQESPPDDVSTA